MAVASVVPGRIRIPAGRLVTVLLLLLVAASGKSTLLEAQDSPNGPAEDPNQSPPDRVTPYLGLVRSSELDEWGPQFGMMVGFRLASWLWTGADLSLAFPGGTSSCAARSGLAFTTCNGGYDPWPALSAFARIESAAGAVRPFLSTSLGYGTMGGETTSLGIGLLIGTGPRIHAEVRRRFSGPRNDDLTELVIGLPIGG